VKKRKPTSRKGQRWMRRKLEQKVYPESLNFKFGVIFYERFI
jgi:hypothetical protein